MAAVGGYAGPSPYMRPPMPGGRQLTLAGGVNWRTGAPIAPANPAPMPQPTAQTGDPNAEYYAGLERQQAIQDRADAFRPTAPARRPMQPSAPAPATPEAPAKDDDPTAAPTNLPMPMSFARPQSALDPGTGWADLNAPGALQPNLGVRLPRQATEALRSLRMGGGLY